jgi:UDP-N-acetylglucosamine transferase subunit ALG13
VTSDARSGRATGGADGILEGEERPLLFVTVGTDHHPFDRLIDWIDDWMRTRQADVRCFVQSGTSRAPRHAEAAAYLTHEQMEAKVAEARAVVSHGGPASIMLCRHAGKTPIVAPRRGPLGEHVDDHQLVFSRRLAADDAIVVVETKDDLERAVADALQREAAAGAAGFGSVPEAVSRFERLVEGLLA